MRMSAVFIGAEKIMQKMTMVVWRLVASAAFGNGCETSIRLKFIDT